MTLSPRHAFRIRVGILLARRTHLGVDIRTEPVWKRLTRLERNAYEIERIHVEHRADECRRQISVWIVDAFQLRQLPPATLPLFPAAEPFSLGDLVAMRYRFGGIVNPRQVVIVGDGGEL